MSQQSDEVERLREENARLKAELNALRGQAPANGAAAAVANGGGAVGEEPPAACPAAAWDPGHGLSKDQIARYSRQLILHSFGAQAQARLCRGSVLIVGAGGLGSPAALYLAAAGIGRIGIVDKDEVELNNLHRQIIHREASVGQHKALSAAAACAALNSSLQLETHCEGFTPANAVALVQRYDVVVDASDNAPTRYLISDACAVAKRPLVSGAAIGMDGQLTVYCHGEDGPCYRCLFPVAPRPESCSRCCDAGVLGAVPGVIGTLQAVEAIKILSGVGEPMSRRLLLVDTLSSRFHLVKLRARSPECVACGDAPTITAQTLADYDYVEFTGQRPSDAAPRPLELIPLGERITPAQLQARLRDSSRLRVVVDVRPPEQFNICHLPGAFSAPYAKLDAHLGAIQEAVSVAGAAAAAGATAESPSAHAAAEGSGSSGGAAPAASGVDVLVVCRRGNDSQRAVAKLRAVEGLGHAIDVVGGMEAWAREVDPAFPTY